MPTQSQTPTQDQVVQAGICVYDYVLSPAVRGELNRDLVAAKASPDNGEKILQGFFDRRQYATTPAAFKQVFSDYAKNPLTLSPQATRFAIDFAANSVLRLDCYDAARAMAAAQRAADGAAAPSGADPDLLAPFADVIKRNNSDHRYDGVTPDQASLAITRLLTSGIAVSTGIYSQTTIVDQQGKSGVGPTLTIDSSKDPVQVTLDKKHIFGYTFDPDTNTLSWTKGGTGTFTNDTAAKLEFSRYNGGPSFTGTLDNRDGSFSYQGSTDQGGTAANNSVRPLATAQTPSDDLVQWVAVVGGIVGGITGIAGVIATAVGAHYTRVAFNATSKTVVDKLTKIDADIRQGQHQQQQRQNDEEYSSMNGEQSVRQTIENSQTLFTNPPTDPTARESLVADVEANTDAISLKLNQDNDLIVTPAE